MPRDVAGTYTLPEAPFQPNTVAQSAKVNNNLTDIAAALTDSLSISVTQPLQANLDLNGHGIDNIGGTLGDITTGNIAAGNIAATGDISTSTGNITSNHAVIGDHLFAFRTGSGYGGVIGSWDTTTGKGAGFQLNANVTPALMQFGPADPGLGTLTTVALTLSAAGNLNMAGTLAVGSSLALAGAADMVGLVNMHSGLRLNGISPYANQAAASAAGHVTGDVYFNTTVGALSVVL